MSQTLPQAKLRARARKAWVRIQTFGGADTVGTKYIVRMRQIPSVARPDYYRRLGVSHRATEEAIRRAYLGLAKELHPDVNKRRGSHEEFLAVKEAYEILSNPLLRREYDERMAAEPFVGFDAVSRKSPMRTVRASAPFVPVRRTGAVRLKTASEQHRQRQLSFLYTATVAGSSVAFLAGAFFLVSLGGVIPGIVAFLMGLTLVLVMLHVLPFARPK